MKALRINAQRRRKKHDVSIYLKCNFNIGDWKFRWCTPESEDSEDTLIDGKRLVMYGGFLGHEASMTVQNPMLLAIAISTVIPCEIECGGRLARIYMKFGKTELRKATVDLGGDKKEEQESGERKRRRFQHIENQNDATEVLREMWGDYDD
ncbi:MAG: hypothetical protein HFJ48_04835 [Clostridia bacterium]|nr:hypothetical protein [Clostridia bacterium]